MQYWLPIGLIGLFLSACSPVVIVDAGANGTVPQPGRGSNHAAWNAGDLPAGTFTFEEPWNPSGTVYIRGYAKREDGETPYVWLMVQESGNPAFDRFLAASEGNAFAGPGRIGIGCVRGGEIQFENQSDELGMATFGIPAAGSRAILDSSERQPILLRLTKLPSSTASGAPACYSHITRVDVLRATGNS